MIDSLLKSFQDIFKFVGKLPEKFLKKGTTQLKGQISGESKSFFTWDNWPYFLAIILIAVLIWLLIRQIRRRRSKKEAAADPQEKPQEKEQTLPRSSLRNIWKTFLKEIPGEFRRSILLYDPFLVFGDIGSGKSLLIDTYTDWKGQANQFYPSYTVNPLLQIYLGSKALVQEIPASLLNNTSMEVRKALQKLWKPLFRWRDPTVVAVLNAEMLQSGNPEELKRQAQMFRGKINVLSRIRKKPIKLFIAITAADTIDGYHDFFSLLRQNNARLKLEFTTPSDLENITTCLQAYEDLLPQALTTLSAGAYLKVISFFKSTPGILAPLSVFIKILQNHDPLSPEPVVRRIFFTSGNDDDRSVSNPFQTEVEKTDIRGLLPLYKHQIAAAAIALAGLLYIAAGFIHEKQTIATGNRMLAAFQSSPVVSYEKDMRQPFQAFKQDVLDEGAGKLLPRFSPDRIKSLEYRIQSQYASNIREFYLLPRLEQLAWEQNAQDRTLFLIALIYASEDNRLGEIVTERMDRWSRMLDLPEVLIRDYLKNNQDMHAISIPFDTAALKDTLTATYDPHPWIIFFTGLNKIIEEQVLSSRTAHDIDIKTDAFLDAIHNAEQYDLKITIADLIKNETTHGLMPAEQQVSKRGQLLQEPLRDFLVFLRENRTAVPPVAEISLEQFMDSASVMLVESVPQDKVFKFTIANERYVFSAAKWNDLVAKTSLIRFLRAFEKENFARYDVLSFLGVNDVYPDIEMNVANDGQFIFMGKGKVRGIYTKEAIEKGLKPVLARLPEFVKMLPVAENEKNRFSRYVLATVDTYAKKYESAYREYYQQFNIKAQNMEELQYVLTQLQLPSSPFQRFLEVIKENTIFEPDDNPFFEPIPRRLKTFAFTKRVMQGGEEEPPEFSKYTALIAQMKEALLSDKPFEPGKEPQAADELKSNASPLGRLFISVYLEEENSYYHLVSKWMQSVGIDPVWQFPFMDPVYQAYLLGLKEIESIIVKEWSGLEDRYVLPVLTRYPFNEKSESEAKPEDLVALLSPEGEFRAGFNRFVLPLCMTGGDMLEVRDFPMGSIKLPGNALQTAQTVTQLTKLFYDGQGKPKALTTDVKPLLAQPAEQQGTVVILTHLQSGKSSVFGFYQQPAWQKLSFEWWKYQQSSVGVELATRKHNRKKSHHLTIPKSSWSFLRLIKMAEPVDDNAFMWKIDSPEMETGTLDVVFAIKNNPWNYFSPTQGLWGR